MLNWPSEPTGTVRTIASVVPGAAEADGVAAFAVPTVPLPAPGSSRYTDAPETSSPLTVPEMVAGTPPSRTSRPWRFWPG